MASLKLAFSLMVTNLPPVVDTSGKFAAGVVDTGGKLSAIGKKRQMRISVFGEDNL